MTDRLGSVRATTNGSGTISAQYSYDAWGTPTNTAGSYGFAGEPQSAAGGGLLYLRARWYRPNTGRFLTTDPYAGSANSPASLHRYLYGADDPVDNTDHSGRVSQGCSSQSHTLATGKSKCEELAAYITKLVNSIKASEAASLLYQAVYNRDLRRDTIATYLAWYFTPVPAQYLLPALGDNPLGLPLAIIGGQLSRTHKQDLYQFVLRTQPLIPGGVTEHILENGELSNHPDLVAATKAPLPKSGNYTAEWKEQNVEKPMYHWIKENYPDQVLDYGFKDDYWSNTHHFFFGFFYGYARNELIGQTVNGVYEHIGGNTPGDYRVGNRAATLGDQFRNGSITPEELPDKLRREMVSIQKRGEWHESEQWGTIGVCWTTLTRRPSLTRSPVCSLSAC